MRAIKFRAWHGNVMLEWGLFDDWCARFVQANNCPVMQFTGLRDKNDTDIYEGDIVRYNTGETWIVRWSARHAGFIYVGNNKGNRIDQLPKMREVEVIGNIHANPGLLKEAA